MYSKIVIGIALFFAFSTISLGQCYPDRHNTSNSNMWKSCIRSMCPNEDRGFTHWIMYSLEESKYLGEMQLWNLNDPEDLKNGIKDFTVDVSVDGTNWVEALSSTLEVSNGHSIYEGGVVGNLDGIEAKYIIISSISNQGGWGCVGFSEVKIELMDKPCGSPNLVFDENHQSKTKYWALNRIESHGNVAPDQSLDYFAGKEIELLNDFEVKKGASFEANIQPCPDNH